jgi:hypothetical protein
MFLFSVRKSVAMAAAAIACLAVSGQVFAQATDIKLPNVTYTASGTFGDTPISGNDLFRLAGEPFSINIVANEATVPKAHTAGHAVYTGLKMKGKVTSALVPQSPFTIESAHTFVAIAVGSPTADVFEMIAPVVVVKQRINITAKIVLPKGILQKGWRIYPFSGPGTLGPTTGTVTYSDGTNTTTLSFASGTLNCQKGVPSAGTTASVHAVVNQLDGMQLALNKPEMDAIEASYASSQTRLV